MQTFQSHDGRTVLPSALAVIAVRLDCTHAHGTTTKSASLNLARFDLVTFHLIVLCADLGSLCSAAKIAHISKSAASHRITTLEDYIGKKLFHRHHNGLELTDAGALCVERGRKILEEARGLKHRLASM